MFKETMFKVVRKLRVYKNSYLLWRGYTLINNHGYYVYLDEKGNQVWNNPRRKAPYSLDDKSWRVYCER